MKTEMKIVVMTIVLFIIYAVSGRLVGLDASSAESSTSQATPTQIDTPKYTTL
jgi:hypothetical protein